MQTACISIYSSLPRKPRLYYVKQPKTEVLIKRYWGRAETSFWAGAAIVHDSQKKKLGEHMWPVGQHRTMYRTCDVHSGWWHVWGLGGMTFIHDGGISGVLEKRESPSPEATTLSVCCMVGVVLRSGQRPAYPVSQQCSQVEAHSHCWYKREAEDGNDRSYRWNSVEPRLGKGRMGERRVSTVDVPL